LSIYNFARYLACSSSFEFRAALRARWVGCGEAVAGDFPFTSDLLEYEEFLVGFRAAGAVEAEDSGGDLSTMSPFAPVTSYTPPSAPPG
jgi:hypothetical protein